MINLIIADDDIKVRRGLVQLIDWESMGVKVVFVAKNGKEVAETLKNVSVDVVISDIRMPVMDGLELARYIKENSLDVSVILLSGYAEFEYAQEALNQGVRQYILKPLSREKLNILSHMVIDIINEKKIRTNLIRKMHSSHFRNEILDVLRSGNYDGVDSLMELDSESMKNPPDVVRDYYLFLLSVVKDFVEENDFADILPHYTEKMMELTALDAYVSYAKNIFHEVMVGYEKRKSGNVVSNVKSYIEMFYDNEDLATASLSEYFSLSASYLSSLFKRETGVSITQYITDCRMENASKLLTTTNLPIHIIARKVGYPNIPYFNKVFKTYHGISPALYRTKGGGEQ